MPEKKRGLKSSVVRKDHWDDSGKDMGNAGHGIAYQNKDITSKYLAENFGGKTFRVYGLDIPGIRRALPTNIPAVKANELRLDNLFELEDGTAAIVDYESEYKHEDKVKYLNYLAGIANRYRKENKSCPMLRMVVIYTGDIRREQVSGEYDIGAVRVRVDAAFLSELDGEGIFCRLKGKVEGNEPLTDEEMMEFIIFPLSFRKVEEKERKVQDAVELAAKIQDKEQQAFILSGILAFTDKIIDRETAKRIMEAIEMTQIAKMYEEEKRRAVAQKEKEVTAQKEKEKRQAVAQTEKETAFRSIIETCQDLGVSLTDTTARIASKFSITQAESEVKVREYWK